MGSKQMSWRGPLYAYPRVIQFSVRRGSRPIALAVVGPVNRQLAILPTFQVFRSPRSAIWKPKISNLPIDVSPTGMV